MRTAAALAIVLLPLIGGSVMAAGEKMTLDELRAARKRAAHRTRRIIFNNDGNEPVYYLDEATEKAFLACRTTPLLGSQVDSIFYCTWSSGFSFFTHDTKVGQVFDTTVNPKDPANKIGGFSKNKTREFIKQGTDPLKMMVAWCKAHSVEIFWSFRMNDTHDAWGAWYSDPLFPQLKRDHPEWLVGSKAKRPPHGAWSAVDYGRQEIRDLAIAFIEEVCQNYGVGGIEMDFFRHPLLFKTPASGKDATADELAKMTAMARRVRQVTEREGLKRGRPILVAVRVPDSAAYCKAMGIDIEAWLAEGLIDLMAVSGYFRLNPWEVSVALGHRHGVPVYPCLSETRVRDSEARKVRASLACYRARAAEVWAKPALARARRPQDARRDGQGLHHGRPRPRRHQPLDARRRGAIPHPPHPLPRAAHPAQAGPGRDGRAARRRGHRTGRRRRGPGARQGPARPRRPRRGHQWQAAERRQERHLDRPCRRSRHREEGRQKPVLQDLLLRVRHTK